LYEKQGRGYERVGEINEYADRKSEQANRTAAETD
jgi:hypothetical protein